MYAIKRLLVALDLSEIDKSLIQYAKKISEALSMDKIYFVTVVKKLDLPDEITSLYPNLLAPVDESIKQQISNSIEKIMGGEVAVAYDIDVLEGDVTQQALHWAKVKEVDLIVVGKKLGSDSRGLNGSKIARLAPCHVAFVTKDLPERINHLLVPVDFSDSSQLAVQLAIRICRAADGGIVNCIHIYHVPSGYHVSGKSKEEFAEIMKNTAIKLYGQFISSVDTKGIEVKCDFILGDQDHINTAVFNFALAIDATGIVIGSKGKTKAAAWLLGSTTEKFIHMNVHYPIIVAKPKNQMMDIFDVIAT